MFKIYYTSGSTTASSCTEASTVTTTETSATTTITSTKATTTATKSTSITATEPTTTTTVTKWGSCFLCSNINTNSSSINIFTSLHDTVRYGCYFKELYISESSWLNWYKRIIYITILILSNSDILDITTRFKNSSQGIFNCIETQVSNK